MTLPDAVSIKYRIRIQIGNKELNTLFNAAWDTQNERDFRTILNHSLSYVCAYADETLVGFVNLAWDGGIHAFILDTTVHPSFQKQGIGKELVKRAIQEARAANCEWVHVDYEEHLDGFYQACGFESTYAGLFALK